MMIKTASLFSLAALTFFQANASLAQTALPTDISTALNAACVQNEANTSPDNVDNTAICSQAAATLAIANPSLSQQIASFAVNNGSSGTASLLAQQLANSDNAAIQNQLADIVAAIVAADPTNVAEILIVTASAFPEEEQQVILTQLVAQVQSNSPGLLDDTAVAALGLPINPAFRAAGVGLQDLDAVSPD